MVDAPGYPQVSGEESGGGAGAAHIDACLRSGERPAQARDPHDFSSSATWVSKPSSRIQFRKCRESSEKSTPRRVEVPRAKVASSSARLVMLLEPGTAARRGCFVFFPAALSYTQGTAYTWSVIILNLFLIYGIGLCLNCLTSILYIPRIRK